MAGIRLASKVEEHIELPNIFRYKIGYCGDWGYVRVINDSKILHVRNDSVGVMPLAILRCGDLETTIEPITIEEFTERHQQAINYINNLTFME